jgi:hypothetical protein
MLRQFFIKNRESNNSINNVFKSISKRPDIECQNVSNNSYFYNVCDRDHNKNIIKYYDLADDVSKEIYEWEVQMYLYMMDSKLSVKTLIDNNKIIYDVHDKISVYTFLNRLKNNNNNIAIYKLILNEIFSFVCKFKEHNFIHGNLNIHNIFINPIIFYSRCKFYILDFSNSIVIKKNQIIKPQIDEANSFLMMYIKYYDYFMLYNSLKKYFSSDPPMLQYLNDVIDRYIKKDVLVEMNNSLTIESFIRNK